MGSEHAIGSRWYVVDGKVYEKRDWGWKFLGISKSGHPIHIMELDSHDWDSPYDIINDCSQGEA